MVDIQEHLWCCVPKGAAVSEGLVIIFRGELFREAEINQLDMAVPIEHDIFGLQIPVDYLLFVEHFQSDKHLSSIELDPFFFKPEIVHLWVRREAHIKLILENLKQVLSRLVFKYEVDRISVRIGITQADEEFGDLNPLLYVLADLLFILEMVYPLLFINSGFRDAL